MLKHQLLHPDILAALARAGHGSRVLIADGNYPARTSLGKNAALVSLNLSPGLVSGVQTLAALVSAIPVESAAVMQYATTGPYGLKGDPDIWADYQKLLPGLAFERVERFAFYQQAAQDNVALVIQTAEQRIYANLLLTIGVVMPQS